MAKKTDAPETDSVYFLKILLFFVLGTIWLQWHGRTIFPAGLVLGLIFAHKDHFRIDRKIEYVILLIAAFLGLIGLGLFINLTF
jgi:hypothetical protein